MTRYILKRLMILLPALLIHTAAGAQFYVDENDKASTKWEYVSSKNFRIIYPVGSDSLATDYLRALELYRPEVAKSVGMVSGQFMSKPLDVILHTSNSVSNGIVAWTPSRVDLYTIPMWTEPNALPWLTNLAIHEGRHMAQMQSSPAPKGETYWPYAVLEPMEKPWLAPTTHVRLPKVSSSFN